MKKALLFVLLLAASFTLSQSVKAQTMYFCESVSNDGYPNGESSVFNIPSAGGYLNVLVRLPYSVDVTSVRYEIYKVDRNGNESYDNTIYQDTQRDWVWFWKQVTFYDPGTYNIYLYDPSNYLLTSGSVKIQYR